MQLGGAPLKIRNRKKVEELAALALELASKNDIYGADILYSEGAGNSLSLLDGVIENCVSGENSGIGVRTILKDGRQGVAYGNRLDTDSIKELVEWSNRNAGLAEPEENITLYHGKMEKDETIILEDHAIYDITPEYRMNNCLKMTEIARKMSDKVLSVRSAGWNDGWGASYYATTTGLSGWEQGNSVSCGVAILAGDGRSTEMNGYGTDTRTLADINIETITERAVKSTVNSLGAKQIQSGTYTLILEPETASSFIEIIGGLFCAPAIHRGKSLMKNRLGETVASSCITLTDNGRLSGGIGSGSWDSEGVPTKETVLIENGIAQNYLYNLQYARKDGVPSTGNAYRGMSSTPGVDTTNLILKPGTETRTNIIKTVKKGMCVTDLMGLHTIDPVTGDFSLGAKGYAVINGEIAYPVCGVTIAGNLIDFIKHITVVASDSEFFGGTAASTMVVENIVIAGE